jgi:activator of 2-hydroxyglutaryl-CoA dehydratase
MHPHLNILGIDIGSVSISVVVLNWQKEIAQTAYECHHGNIPAKLKNILKRFNLNQIGAIAATASTPSILKANRRYDNRVAVMAAATIRSDRFYWWEARNSV